MIEMRIKEIQFDVSKYWYYGLKLSDTLHQVTCVLLTCGLNRLI